MICMADFSVACCTLSPFVSFSPYVLCSNRCTAISCTLYQHIETWTHIQMYFDERKKFCILVKMLLKFVPEHPIDSTALVRVITWRGAEK